MAKSLPRTLNLLQPSEEPVSAWDKIYFWVSTVGRYVIIVVELVVLIMFASRFMLDRQNNDLIEEIDVKVKMLEAQKETETHLRSVQATLVNLTTLIEDQETLSPQLENLLDQIPSGIEVDDFSISQNSIGLNGRSPDYETVKELEVSLREDPSYDHVSVSLKKSSSEHSEVSFEIQISFATKENARAQL